MGALFAYSIVPALSVALLLGFTALLRGRNARGLALYCLTTALWCGSLLLMCFPSTRAVGTRLVGVGALICAAYLHAAYDLTAQRFYALVWLAYGAALAVCALCAYEPSLLHLPAQGRRGPLFWPAIGAAGVAAIIPLHKLWIAYRSADTVDRRAIRGLALAGLLGYLGAWLNSVLLSGGTALPVGLYGVLASLLLLANVVRAHEPVEERRLLDRSLLYSALAALLSAGFLFGIMSLMSTSTEPLLREYKVGALLLLFLAALAFEPLRQQLSEWFGRHVLKAAAPADLARALAAQEVRADQAGRLAELGQFASAVAHEVRNPLGVLAAHLRMLERQGADAATLTAMREQIDRASHFVDDLLVYGRPRPLQLRVVDLWPTVELALSTARQGMGPSAPNVQLERGGEGDRPLVEADQAQLSQLFTIVLENALHALAGREAPRLRVTVSGMGSEVCASVEDNGPGIPPELLPRLFQPFVTSRGRDSAHQGNGLGLAIARGIVERHSGRISGKPSELGGARFEIVLPRAQPLLTRSAAGQARKQEGAA